MTSPEFVIWLKGFMEACNDYTATPKQWDRIREVLYEVEDPEDNSQIDEEIDNWYPDRPVLSGTLTPSYGIFNTSGSTTTTVWSDKKGNWHYTNQKQQLND